jgi:ABC-2 type transport system ATP-binding protein
MDPIGTRQFKDLIRTLAARGKTILLSSHLLADVEDVCDRVCILYGGRMRALGSVNELLAQEGTMQLTTDELDEPTLAQVQDVLMRSGKEIRRVSVSRNRLEDLFLRIVKEAQDAHLSTGGAVAGGAVAEFLRGEPTEGRQVIEELVQAAQPEPEAAPVLQATETPPEPAKEVLRELTEPAPAADDGLVAAPPTAPQADRAVLDELLGNDRKESP